LIKTLLQQKQDRLTRIEMSKSAALLLVLVFLTASCLIAVKPSFSSSAVPAENTWTSKATIQSFPNGVAVVNGKIYTFGRYETFEYEPITNAWLTKKPLPTQRSNFGITVYENKIYVIGGWVRTDLNGVATYSPANEVYDPSTDTWETKTPMPTASYDTQAVAVKGKIYVISPNVNFVYDPAADSWTPMKPMPTSVDDFASATINDKIYVIGGWTEYQNPRVVNLNQIYDPETDTWSLGAPMLTAVRFAAASATTGVMAPKRIYVIGGMLDKSSDGIKINQVYNPENNSWTTGASMPTARHLLCVAVVNDMIYAMGGWSFFMGPGCSENEQYTPFGYGTVPPVISVASPENRNYTASEVALNFTVNRQVEWTGYSLDGQENVTTTGNTTITGLPNGLHNITVYAKDEFENTGVSETVSFSVEVPFPTELAIAASVATVAVVGVGLLFYFKRRKR
jgi:hypothetical protein